MNRRQALIIGAVAPIASMIDDAAPAVLAEPPKDPGYREISPGGECAAIIALGPSSLPADFDVFEHDWPGHRYHESGHHAYSVFGRDDGLLGVLGWRLASMFWADLAENEGGGVGYTEAIRSRGRLLATIRLLPGGSREVVRHDGAAPARTVYPPHAEYAGILAKARARAEARGR